MKVDLQTPAPLVSVIIASWNGRSWLAQCLPALQQQTFVDFEVIVVDNGSTDDTVVWLEENWPTIKVVPLKINLGFAAANNIGIRTSRSHYIVTLNNDTLVDPQWLDNMVTAVSAPDIGMVAPKITIWNQPDKLDSAGIEVDWLGTAWNRGYQQSAAATYTNDVFGPSAAAALYRREMLDQIGLFDENFFAYYEDVDLAWRGRRAGWRCIYTSGACVQHWHSATGEKTPKYKAYLIGRNKIWCFIKNYKSPLVFFIAPAFFLYDGLAAIIQSFYLRSSAPLYGRLQGWSTTHYVWSKRTKDSCRVSLIQLVNPENLKQRIRIKNSQA